MMNKKLGELMYREDELLLLILAFAFILGLFVTEGFSFGYLISTLLTLILFQLTKLTNSIELERRSKRK